MNTLPKNIKVGELFTYTKQDGEEKDYTVAKIPSTWNKYDWRKSGTVYLHVYTSSGNYRKLSFKVKGMKLW